MGTLLFGIVFLLIVGAIAFLVTYWVPILLGILGVIMIAIVICSIYNKALKKKISRVVKAYIVHREPITKREKEVIGYEENAYYYPYWYSEVYRYNDVLVGYRVTFAVEYEDGERDAIACKKGSYAYHQLLKISERKKTTFQGNSAQAVGKEHQGWSEDLKKGLRKSETDPNYKEGRKIKDVPKFSEYFAKNKKGELTATECCKELGISRSKWYSLCRRALEKPTILW